MRRSAFVWALASSIVGVAQAGCTGAMLGAAGPATYEAGGVSGAIEPWFVTDVAAPAGEARPPDPPAPTENEAPVKVGAPVATPPRADISDLVVYTDPGEIPRLQIKGGGQERLPLKHTHVKARLTGFVAEVEVRQTYENTAADPIEAVYIFPLPENSAVNRMRMEIGERVIEAQIKRRGEAKRIYTEARRTGHTAALLEQERPNIFTQSVANIEPGKRIDVVIRYVQDLTYDAGQYEFVFPMVVGPRYVAGEPTGSQPSGSGTHADTDQVPDASRITPPVVGHGTRTGHDISIDVVADASLTIGEFEVPTHEVMARQPADGTLRLTLAERQSLPNRDFVLRYSVSGQEPRATLFLSGQVENQQDGFFSLVVHPPALDIEDLVGRRELIFVVDVSGSMSGLPLALCRDAIRKALARMRPVDTFNIITFSGRTGQVFAAPRPANDANVLQALDYVDNMRAGGGTEILNAVDAALSTEVEVGRHRYVFFLTDGYVSIEAQASAAAERLVTALERRGQRARVFGFGVGSSVNRQLLEGLSRAGNGVAVYATAREHPLRAVNQFYRYIDHSVLRNVNVGWGDLQQSELSPPPAEIPDLFASHALIIHGRYSRVPRAPLTVTGDADGRRVTIPVTVRSAEVQGNPAEVLASLWARTRVDDLEQRLWHSRDPALEEQITDLGLDFNLVTRFTSLVAVDNSRRVGQGNPRLVVQPVAAPEAVNPVMAGAVVVNSLPMGGGDTTEYSFDDGIVEGQLVRPDGDFSMARARGRQSSLIRTRTHFDQEDPEEAVPTTARGPRGCHCRAVAMPDRNSDSLTAASLAALALLAMAIWRRRRR